MEGAFAATLAGRPLGTMEPDPDFTGREWVLDRIDAWLAKGSDAPRFFHIVGEPGSGKTALSRELARLAAGDGASPASRLSPGFLAAQFFCSARDRRWVSPLTFAESIALQLSRASDAFQRAMLAGLGAPPPKVEQHVTEARDAVIGVYIRELNATGPSSEDAFNRLVREPLEALCSEEPRRPVTILVDALDESLAYKGDVGILPLIVEADALPAGVRFILTSRPEPEIERILAPRAADVERLELSAPEWDTENAADIGAYVARRFAHDPLLAPKVTALGASAALATVAINERSGGNFLYARFLLDAIAMGAQELAALHAPLAAAEPRAASGLDALYLLYMQSLQRVTEVGKRDWQTQYAPLMEALSAAQETLPRQRLRAFSGQKELDFRGNLDDLRQFVELVTPATDAMEDDGGYRLYHQSFADFLRTPALRLASGEVDNPFFLDRADSHARIADHFSRAFGAGWETCDDRYALRYAATHFAGAASTEGQPERHERAQALVALVTDASFQAAHRRRLDDPVALRSDLARTLDAVATDDHAGAPPLVVRAALALHAVRRESARADLLFERARAGDVDGAERRLALFHVDPAWRQVAALTIAWLAAPVAPGAARALRERVVHGGLDEQLALLAQRVDATLSGAAPPSLPPLSWPPEEHEVVSMLERLGGNPVSGIEPLDFERIDAEAGARSSSDDTPAYLAEQDGPLLVSFAVHTADGRGDGYLSRYIAAQASNVYEYYRNRSLLALVHPVLAHPDDAWVRRRLVELASGALAATSVEFGQALPLTVRALRARAGDAAAASEYETGRDDARRLAGEISPMREGDPWSHHLRRLIAFAEIERCVMGRGDRASALMMSAIALPFGFAGFNAPARLTLADLLRILAPADIATIERAFTMAREAAHNIQDHVFCARATSRVEAMRLHWRPVPGQEPLPAVVATLAREADHPLFAPRHQVGEQFELRAQVEHRLRIPRWARDARTPRAVAALHHRPVADFARLARTPGWHADAILPLGTVLPVPDPDFPPMLAAHLSAECLADGVVPPAKRARLIQALVPVAARDYTALDVVLSRMLLASPPGDAAALAHLDESVRVYVPKELLGEAPRPQPGLPA